jgi:hypothetical protein
MKRGERREERGGAWGSVGIESGWKQQSRHLDGNMISMFVIFVKFNSSMLHQ